MRGASFHTQARQNATALAPGIWPTRTALYCVIRPTAPGIALVVIITIRMSRIGAIGPVPAMTPIIVIVVSIIVPVMAVPFSDSDADARRIDIEPLGIG